MMVIILHNTTDTLSPCLKDMWTVRSPQSNVLEQQECPGELTKWRTLDFEERRHLSADGENYT